METKVLTIDAEKIDSSKIDQAAAFIDSGGLVAFPTETVYGIACRVKSDSLARLDEIKGVPRFAKMGHHVEYPTVDGETGTQGRTSGKYYTLHIGRKSDIANYVPTIGLKSQKLIQNAWPGPLTIVFELDEKDIDKQRNNLEEEVFQGLYHRIVDCRLPIADPSTTLRTGLEIENRKPKIVNRTIGVRCPDNTIAAMMLQKAGGPVVAPSANVTNNPPAVDAGQVLAQLSGRIDLLLDAGPCKYKKSSTVVKIGKKGLEILRPGFHSKAELEALSCVKFLFVCTGNTCRSPMAEGIFRKYLAEKLHYNVDDLDKIGYKTNSAGIIGSSGFPASAEAVTACAAMGVDIKAHRNKALSKELIEESDVIYAMEQIHRDKVIAAEPKAAEKCLLLAGDTGIPDPIGHPQEFYDNCAKLIETAVQKRVGELEI
jgi:L-threonylcarbamoyladenylate synthase